MGGGEANKQSSRTREREVKTKRFVLHGGRDLENHVQWSKVMRDGEAKTGKRFRSAVGSCEID